MRRARTALGGTMSELRRVEFARRGKSRTKTFRQKRAPGRTNRAPRDRGKIGGDPARPAFDGIFRSRSRARRRRRPRQFDFARRRTGDRQINFDVAARREIRGKSRRDVAREWRRIRGANRAPGDSAEKFARKIAHFRRKYSRKSARFRKFDSSPNGCSVSRNRRGRR